MRGAMAEVVNPMFATCCTQSVNLLTAEEYERVKALAPHDSDIALDVWAAFLSRLLERNVSVLMAVDIIKEYNARLVEELTT